MLDGMELGKGIRLMDLLDMDLITSLDCHLRLLMDLS